MQADAVAARVEPDDPVAPADFDAPPLRLQRLQPFHQPLFEMILLQVDERRPLVPGLGQQVEAEQLAVAEEHLAEPPLHALLNQGIAAAEPVENFQRPLGEADGARAEAHLVVVVEHDHRDIMQRQIDGGGEPDRAGADHDDRMARRRRAVLIGRAPVGIERCVCHGGRAGPRHGRAE